MRYVYIMVLCLFGILGPMGADVLAQPGQGEKKYLAQIETEYGKMLLVLYNNTPLHRDNFVKLARAKFFDTTCFHRIIKDFVVQGGDPDSLYIYKERLNKDQHWIKAEFHEGLYHKRGVLAMGRDDNAAKDSFSTQFYLVQGRKWTDAELDALEAKRMNGAKIPEFHREIYKTVGGLPYLDQNYTVFGEIITGLDVLDKLSELAGDKEGVPAKRVGMTIRILGHR